MALVVGLAEGVHLGLGPVIRKETASWACIVAAAPMALAGFFSYHNMSFERLAWAFIKGQFPYAGPRVFQVENIYRKAMARREGRNDA